LQSYTPGKIETGILDEMTFSGTVYQSSASGTMKFLYHDLEVNLALQDKAKWKSSVIAFAQTLIWQHPIPARQIYHRASFNIMLKGT
jgi:hypothetical protein